MIEIPVKNMVCGRCIKSVTSIFELHGVKNFEVNLGKVILSDPLTARQEEEIRSALAAEGFEWLDDKKLKLVEEVKKEIVNLVHYGELDELKVNLSVYLSSRLHKEYHYLTSIFSSLENTTIEQYFILQKIEKVKEWLVYDELSLSEISYRLGYSSVAHLSGQFKKITGFTPSQFKQLKDHHRKAIDKI